MNVFFFFASAIVFVVGYEFHRKASKIPGDVRKYRRYNYSRIGSSAIAASMIFLILGFLCN